MKLFKSSILAILGVAAVLTSCSDDNKYVSGTDSPGAYFADGLATDIYISSEESSFTIPVFRTEDAPLSFSVTAVDESGLFSVPSTVTFGEGTTTTKLTVSYDPAKLAEAHPYELTITLGTPTDYGRNSANFSVSMQSPMVVEPFGAEGTGTYVYNGLWSGEDPGLPITVSYMPSDPNNVVWTISDWGYGIDFQMTCADLTDLDADGDVTIHIPCQFTGYVHTTYGEVWVADSYNYLSFLRDKGFNVSQAEIDSYEFASYYSPETGTFNPFLAYYVPFYDTGGSWFGENYELFQLDGYPNYSVEITYDGLFTDRNQNMTANATILCASDVASVKTVMVEGKDAQVGINEILSDGSSVQEFTAAESISVKYPVLAGGDYTIVAVSFDAKGDAQLYDYDTFEILLGSNNDAANWSDYGVADYVDGWIIQNFAVGGAPIVPLEWAYPVMVQKNISEEPDPNGVLYRLVQPYGEDYPAAALNNYPANRNINFYIDDIYAGIIPQLSGFGLDSWGGELTIGTLEGLYMEDGSFTLGEVAPLLLQTSNAPNVSSYEDNVISIPLPLFGAPGIGDGSFGYSWNTKYTAMIIMPDAPAGVRAKVKAASVAAPKFQGAVSGAKAVKATSRKSLEKLPVKFKKAGKPATLRRH